MTQAAFILASHSAGVPIDEATADAGGWYGMTRGVRVKWLPHSGWSITVEINRCGQQDIQVLRGQVTTALHEMANQIGSVR